MASVTAAVGLVTYARTRRTAMDKRAIPLENRATPTDTPTAQPVLAGEAAAIIVRIATVSMPSNSSQPVPGSDRSLNAMAASRSPFAARYIATTSVTDAAGDGSREHIEADRPV